MAERLKHLSRRDRLRPIGRAMGCGGSTATVAPAAVTNLTAGTAAPGSPRDVGRAVLQAGQKRSGVAVLIIDPQNSFHDGGSLAVPGADEVRGRAVVSTGAAVRAVLFLSRGFHQRCQPPPLRACLPPLRAHTHHGPSPAHTAPW